MPIVFLLPQQELGQEARRTNAGEQSGGSDTVHFNKVFKSVPRKIPTEHRHDVYPPSV